MDLTIYPRRLHGELTIIPSKSQAHRLLICAAFADQPTLLLCPETNQDIEATAECLSALGADILRTKDGYSIQPISVVPKSAMLKCRESGSTLRFLLPIVGALGIDTVFKMEGRLPQRPLSPLWEEMERMGCNLQFISENELRCQGQLKAGTYHIDGSVSSQFITGLLFAASLLNENSHINITGQLQSAPYVSMTQNAMELFGVCTENFHVQGGQYYRSPESIAVEGDWSNGAFFLAANEMGSKLTIRGLDTESSQGDQKIMDILPQLKKGTSVISAADIPDLVPIMSVFAAANHGAVFTEIQRLRLKESDRVASVISMINALGGQADATGETLTVYPSVFQGGIVDAANDHRIAMSAAIAATMCKEPVTILGAECVQKSYPKFWDEYKKLGGHYEQYLR